MNHKKLYFHYNTNEDKKLIDQMDIYRIYDRLLDNESKQIFIDRLLFSLTNDWGFIKDMLIEEN